LTPIAMGSRTPKAKKKKKGEHDSNIRSKRGERVVSRVPGRTQGHGKKGVP